MSRSDDLVPPMSGGELALRLLGAFRYLVDEVHRELALEGHAEVRPVHGFALQAIGPNGATAGEVGARLGVSKQAAGKTIDGLVALGYVERRTDSADARRKIVSLSTSGVAVLRLSGAAFQRLRDERAERLGTVRMQQLEDDLRLLTDPDDPVLDATGWWSASR